MSMVRFKQSELPALTEERKAALKTLAARPESEVDYSDIPPLTDEFWDPCVDGFTAQPKRMPLCGLIRM